MSEDPVSSSQDSPKDSLEYTPSIRVSEEIRRFQTEIQLREQENRRYFQWKEERRWRRSNSVDNLLDKDIATMLKIETESSPSPPQLPKKKNSGTRRVTYSDQIEFNDPDRQPVNRKKSGPRSRQHLPGSTSSPPISPPSGDLTPSSQDDDGEEGGEGPPVLPSVRELKHIFHVPTPELKTQVHSLTARSVSREFRENLKADKPKLTDTIVKLPDTKKITREVVRSSNKTPNTIVYDSSLPRPLYPDGKYLREKQSSHSPRSSSRIPEPDTGYTSDDSYTGVPAPSSPSRRSSSRQRPASRRSQSSAPPARSPAQPATGKRKPMIGKQWTVWT